MSVQIEDRVVDSDTQKGPTAIVEDGGRARPASTSKEGKGDGVVTPIADVVGGGDGRTLSDSTKEKLAALRAAFASDDAPTGEADDATPDDPGADAAEDDTDPDAPPGEDSAAKVESKPKEEPAVESPELVELRATIERQKALLEKTQQDTPAAAAKPDKRTTMLHEAADIYLTDPAAAIRKLVAAAIFADDTESKDVGEEVDAVLTDLTAAKMGVEPDTAYQAKRTAARTRLEWVRDKKSKALAEEKASTDRPDAGERDRQVTQAITTISEHLSAKDNEGKFPNLTKLSQHLDGKPAQRVIWEVLENGVKTGLLDPKLEDGKLFAEAAKLAETYYTRRADALRSHFTSASAPDVAAPAKDGAGKPDATASKDARKGHGARTVTNADASVAPATTPPADKPAEKKPKQFKTEEERKKYALRHLR